jgi:hypothetical protein
MQEDPAKSAASKLLRILDKTAHTAEPSDAVSSRESCWADVQQVTRALWKNAGRHLGPEFFRARASAIVEVYRQREHGNVAPSPEWKKMREDVEAASTAYDAAREAEARV